MAPEETIRYNCLTSLRSRRADKRSPKGVACSGAKAKPERRRDGDDGYHAIA